MNESQKTDIADQNKAQITWSAPAAIIISVAIYFLGQTISGLLISLYPLLRGWQQDASINWLNNSVLAQFIFVVLTESTSILMLYFYLQYKRAKLFVLGFWRKPKWSDVGWSLVTWGLYFLSAIIGITILQNLFPGLDIDQKQQTGFEQVNANWELALTFISLVVLAPVTEEVLARGFLYSGLKKHLPKVLAILCTSILFALVHLQFGSGQPLLWVAGIDTFILSLFLCKLKDMTGSLWAPIMLHMLKNLTAFVVLFVIPM